ncbi:MAG: hypothetical protein AMK73_04655 [Planctomycetes bacterium SM23_32]|nr:MAG: hypothetical protein AMK73_04655 [Planctomycetes bacterium SM23_32]
MGQRILRVFAVSAFVLLAIRPVMGQPADDDASCAIGVTVADVMEWESNFTPITLADITSQAATVSDSESATLYTNGDVDVTADNTTAAQLTGPDSDVLVTEYRLTYDGDGVTDTGGSTVDWTAYDSFLSSASSITHASGDGAVVITLNVRASNPTGEMSNAGAYSATQTLTASWAGP